MDKLTALIAAWLDKYGEWLKAAANRAVRTAAQAALGVIGSAAFASDVNWPTVASAAIIAALVSLLTSVTTALPEVSGAQVGVGGKEA